MSDKEFKGISTSGDFNEALSNAIQDAKEKLHADHIAWEISKISGRSGGFILENILEVTVSVAPPTLAEDQSQAYFQVMDSAEKIYVIKLVESSKIEHARKTLSGKETKRVHIQGTIVKEPASYNEGWSFHLQPSSIDFFEMAMEVCDSNVELVANDLASVGGAFLPGNHWCPWASRLVREIDFKE